VRTVSLLACANSCYVVCRAPLDPLDAELSDAIDDALAENTSLEHAIAEFEQASALHHAGFDLLCMDVA